LIFVEKGLNVGEVLVVEALITVVDLVPCLKKHSQSFGYT
jgi:hypothetical protein